MNKKIEKLNFVRDNKEYLESIVESYIQENLGNIKGSFNQLMEHKHSLMLLPKNSFSIYLDYDRDQLLKSWLGLLFTKFIVRSYSTEQSINLLTKNRYFCFLKFTIFIVDNLYDDLNLLKVISSDDNLSMRYLTLNRRTLKDKLKINSSLLNSTITTVNNIFTDYHKEHVAKFYGRDFCDSQTTLIKYSKLKFSDTSNTLNIHTKLNDLKISELNKKISSNKILEDSLIKLVNAFENIVSENITEGNYPIIHRVMSKHNLYKILSKLDPKFNVKTISGEKTTISKFIDNLYYKSVKIELESFIESVLSSLKKLGE